MITELGWRIGASSSAGAVASSFPEVPVSERDEYLEAVLLVGHGAVISAESAMALFELCDVNPRMTQRGGGPIGRI